MQSTVDDVQHLKAVTGPVGVALLFLISTLLLAEHWLCPVIVDSGWQSAALLVLLCGLSTLASDALCLRTHGISKAARRYAGLSTFLLTLTSLAVALHFSHLLAIIAPIMAMAMANTQASLILEGRMHQQALQQLESISTMNNEPDKDQDPS
ncbi:hypothetical protein [Ferrimonas marina]|uniref:Uncharacterized protein n=1 Tax=Ferrimonas marina TaxID=299255 RepID=A0A1M5TZP1_9GAMM|nr:hypothetical protein [Ferrimonas marina]SHH56070.1 hypothetical protein SAMN02745129_2340 [Ferrimonas marina]